MKTVDPLERLYIPRVHGDSEGVILVSCGAFGTVGPPFGVAAIQDADESLKTRTVEVSVRHRR